jgi:RimJ/RimL family protein N-acetyltransferase
MKAVIIRTKHFTLRPIRKGDLESIARHIDDCAIVRNMLSIPFPYTIKDAREWYRKTRNVARQKKRDRYDFGIEIDDEIVGGIGIFKISGHKAEIGYWLSRSHWGRGIMTGAVKELTRFCFKRLGLRRIYASVFPYNKRSMRVLEKAGYKFEGILRKNVKVRGKLKDEYLFAKVR